MVIGVFSADLENGILRIVGTKKGQPVRLRRRVGAREGLSCHVLRGGMAMVCACCRADSIEWPAAPLVSGVTKGKKIVRRNLK